ncbi:hypothetical protein GH714_028344 [Hevea brasiliensis]|uniref:TFIIS N-terminal domain-containing protein n=1 Tax=Hevea brasiliensis TaxID=3981 RepID=A0A6A6LJM7_HEVBR|nr:hypothetical protein GH714_028344 [Hevea brasiliensis]
MSTGTQDTGYGSGSGFGYGLVDTVVSGSESIVSSAETTISNTIKSVGDLVSGDGGSSGTTTSKTEAAATTTVASTTEHEVKDGDGYGSGSTSTMPRLIHGDEDEENDVLNPYARLFDDEEKKILEIEDLDQSEDSLIDLLQSLADMDITFKSLEETGIGRHVNSLRKHSYYNVRRL